MGDGTNVVGVIQDPLQEENGEKKKKKGIDSIECPKTEIWESKH